MITARSQSASLALKSVQDLQSHFSEKMRFADDPGTFEPVSWLRDGGHHGGGTRLTYGGGDFFNRASLNVSQVHYDDQPERRLGSATAISSIVHPAHPRLPSIHLHISWTEMKTGDGYWRLMADLNPSIPDAADTERFVQAIKTASGTHAPYGIEQGERYFMIPALKRHRGMAHFYLEQFKSADADRDRAFALSFGKSMIDTYAAILSGKLSGLVAPTADERARQLAYHTLYLFQVLTLDRGTTSGLLVHDQNDVGILGSLPARIDRELLKSWGALVLKPQDELVKTIVAAIPNDGRIEEPTKIALCQAMRQFYKKYPDALDLQARGDVLPPTVINHAP